VSADQLPLVGGHPALDFVNTLGGTVDRPIEQLHSYADLLDWAGHAGIAEVRGLARLADRLPDDAAAALTDTIALRAHLDTALRAHLAGREASADLAAIVTAYRSALRQGRLRAIGTGHVWAWPDDLDLDSVRCRLAVHALDLLQHAPLDRMHVCGRCRYLFLDRSKNHSRRWCRMRGCGDTAKMQRYRARRQT
jgi:predicted RNA-binding Zn ribbon-like protein